jgi:tripartite-type tricarboxylate transporter receptor subunit TctC
MKRHVAGAAGAALLLATMSAALPARADDAAGFYSGKTVTILVSFGAGGTYGLYSQLIARHLPKFIPGSPTLVLSYMPGAGGIKATNYLYNVAPKDGSVIGIPPDTLVLSNVLEPNKIKFKASDFRWIGAVVRANNVLVMRSDAAKTMQDLTTKHTIIGGAGPGAPSGMLPLLLKWMTGADIKVVTGYKGSNDILIAMERGEVQGAVFGWTSWKSLRGKWLSSGYATPIVQFGVEKEADLPSVPLAHEIAKTPEARKVVAFMSSSGPIGRSYVLPPKAPDDRLAVLRAAFDKMVKSPEFLADAKQRKAEVIPATGAWVQEKVEAAMKIDASLAETARKAVFGK